MEENKSTIPVSLENLETFKAEMDKSVDGKIAEIPGATPQTFATEAQIKALFAETPATGKEPASGEENA